MLPKEYKVIRGVLHWKYSGSGTNDWYVCSVQTLTEFYLVLTKQNEALEKELSELRKSGPYFVRFGC